MLFASAWSPDPKTPPRRRGLLLSVGLHGALALLLLLLVLPWGRVRQVYPVSRCCSMPLYWTGSQTGGSSRPHPAARKQRRKRPAPAAPTEAEPSSATPVPAVQTPSTQAGIAAPQQQGAFGTGTGSQDAEPAFPVYFPWPGVPDRSLLPPMEKKVIVEVTVSPLGDVTGEKIVQGMGNGLDQIVLDTVKGWRFHPATLNGSAVSSVAEVVFPFNREYPNGEASGAGGQG
ncbi:MAG TPA: TonB family protein [Acidobacteriaceae bacterium]|jgi:TonB family protein|nr:TonB family protein [Acidobacteriaceae bacterium]